MNILTVITSKGTLLAGALLAIGVPAFAVPITGGFGTVAPGVLSFANSTNSVHKIDFCPEDAGSPGPQSGCTVASNGVGTFLASGGSGAFSPIVNFSTSGTILDLVDQPGNAPFTYFPVGAPNQNINNFLTLAGAPFTSWNFQADEFVAQGCANTATTLCIGGFILTQVGNNVSVSFTVNGTIFDTSNVYDATPFTYIVSGQFNNTSKEAVAIGAQTEAGVYSNTWSGSLITPSEIPEPGTMSMLGIGALAMVLGRLRAKRGSDSN